MGRIEFRRPYLHFVFIINLYVVKSLINTLVTDLGHLKEDQIPLFINTDAGDLGGWDNNNTVTHRHVA